MVYHSPQETAWGVTMGIKAERTLVPAALRTLRWGVCGGRWAALETGKQYRRVPWSVAAIFSFGLV